ncbi:uncharacterized protein G2W53_014843 [Senna tora]|uniref:Uncharacterized protein n=1 Tax=Senna tora TaxID=362788 RepID=A0A834WUC1_9FABA|nr:uncharacterized protein G2W53_014843 [Senna tora]
MATGQISCRHCLVAADLAGENAEVLRERFSTGSCLALLV